MSFDRRDKYDDRLRADGRDESDGAHGADVSPVRDGPESGGGPDGSPLARENQDRTADRDNVQAKARIEYRAHAIERGCERVRETEETTVTPAMRRIEADDPDRSLTGLEFRLKGKDRIEEKIENWTKADAGLTYAEAFRLVKDAIRYTFYYSDDRYTEGVEADCERLKDAGFELVDRTNSWTAEEYKGINSRWRVSENGQLFEVQFHTEASFEAKQLTHSAYERIRDPTTPHGEMRGLRDFQREVCATIPIPPRATDILDYP